MCWGGATGPQVREGSSSVGPKVTSPLETALIDDCFQERLGFILLAIVEKPQDWEDIYVP